MNFDIGTLAITTSIINLLSLIILWVNVKLNENIRGFKLWVLGNACNCVGIVLLIIRDVISSRFITVIIGNELIILGAIFIYIGIMRFIEEKLNYRIIASSYAGFTILHFYFTYVNDIIVIRSIVFSFYIAVYLILAGLILLKNKDCSIKTTTNFLGAVILGEGLFFSIRGIVIITSIFSSNLFDVSILEMSTFVISIIVNPVISFGLILMVNLKLNSEIRVANETLQLIFDTTPDALYITRLKSGIIEKVNDKFYAISGFSKEEVIGETTISLGLWNNPQERQRFIADLNANLQCDNFEMTVRQKNGSLITVLISAKLMELNGESYIINVAKDISERKKAEELLRSSEKRYRDLAEDIKYLSYHDQLTGLYNRRFYEEELNSIDIEENLPLTLIMADVNGLKLINDAFGHLEGDKLIKEIAKVFKTHFTQDEVIARIGGDEFIILLPKTDAEKAQEIVESINKAIGNKKIDNMILSVSLGVGTKYELSKEITKIYIEAEDEMYRNKLIESNLMKKKTIELIIKTFHENNEIEKHHCERVSELCTSIGNALGLGQEEVNKIKIAGLLHDIGKAGIDEKILSKTERLDESERIQTKRHSEIGYQLLKSSNEFSHISEVVLAHHERWDGDGYPKGLKGEKIPFISRIIAIAEAYDEMTSMRKHHSSLSSEAALEELEKNAGIQFDAELVNVFVNKVIKEKIKIK